MEISERQNDVAILYGDICDFDSIVKIEGRKVVSHLDELYRAFDTLCVHFGCQKIETVGKTYMAASGITGVEEHLPLRLKKMPKE